MRFHAPTRIVFGPGSVSQVKAEADLINPGARPFVVTDKGVVAAGIAGRVLSQFADKELFDAVEANPKHTTVNRAGEIARKLRPGLVIGVGGGSALDAAKAVALLATNPGGIEDYEGRAKYQERPLPVLAVPTTCGTGSEVTWVAVITHTGRKFKMSIKGPAMFPAAAVVDPDLLRSLPGPLVASTGMDALTHAIEAYTSKAASAMTDVLAREAARLILDALPAAAADIQGQAESLERLMWGSVLAGLAFGNSDVGAVHCLAEALGSLFDLPHGTANAVFLPLVMEFNLPVAGPRFAELARLAGIDDPDPGSAARKLVARIKALSRSLRIPSFSGLKVPESAFQELAEKSFQNNSNPSNPREANVEDYLSIIRNAAREA